VNSLPRRVGLGWAIHYPPGHALVGARNFVAKRLSEMSLLKDSRQRNCYGDGKELEPCRVVDKHGSAYVARVKQGEDLSGPWSPQQSAVAIPRTAWETNTNSKFPLPRSARSPVLAETA